VDYKNLNLFDKMKLIVVIKKIKKCAKLADVNLVNVERKIGNKVSSECGKHYNKYNYSPEKK